jgi:hypothetical protein
MSTAFTWIFFWVIFGLGALVCLINFYTSFLRYPLHRLRGLPRESFRWVSGFPLVGSLLVAFAFMWLHQLPVMIPVCIILILIDTGGIHWFLGLGVMTYQLFHQIYELLVQKRRG